METTVPAGMPLGPYVVDKRQRGQTVMHRMTAIHNMRYRALWALALFFLTVLASAVQSQAREITDIFGRKFQIADKPQRIYSASPPVTYLLYAIDPAILAGLNFPIKEEQKKYLRKSMQDLPVLGGWFGQTETPNLETILKTNPEVIIVQRFGSVLSTRINEKVMKTMPMPVVHVTLDGLSDYPSTLLYLGRLLGREAHARTLAAYAQKTTTEVAAAVGNIPEHKKVSVYYAEGMDGLNTECDTSGHAELINLAGGQNVRHCQVRDLYGSESISFEQVMLYNPDIILVKEPVFYTRIFTDPRWNQIRAVKNKRVYLIPGQPFNWFDRPPSFMRLLGVKWLANLLYPERYRINIVKEVQQFFKLFLSVSLTAEEAGKLVQAQ